MAVVAPSLLHGTAMAMRTLSVRCAFSAESRSVLAVIPRRVQLRAMASCAAVPVTRRVAFAGVRSGAAKSAAARALGVVNPGPWQRFVGLRSERAGGKREPMVIAKRGRRGYRAVASADARDGRVRLRMVLSRDYGQICTGTLREDISILSLLIVL